MMRITKEKKYKTRFQELAAVAFHLTLMMISYSFTTKNYLSRFFPTFIHVIYQVNINLSSSFAENLIF